VLEKTKVLSARQWNTEVQK